MSRRRPFVGGILVAMVAVSLMSGCVDRRFIVESEPPNANVYVNGKLIGASPADMQFTYYGKYRFTFVRDGYQTLTVDETINPPWYEFFPIEFIAENVLPFTIRDIHYIRKPLEWPVAIPADEIRARGEALREQGKTIGTAPLPGTLGAPIPPEPPVAPGPTK
jgi:hypothetical protein